MARPVQNDQYLQTEDVQIGSELNTNRSPVPEFTNSSLNLTPEITLQVPKSSREPKRKYSKADSSSNINHDYNDDYDTLKPNTQKLSKIAKSIRSNSKDYIQDNTRNYDTMLKSSDEDLGIIDVIHRSQPKRKHSLSFSFYYGYNLYDVSINEIFVKQLFFICHCYSWHI